MWREEDIESLTRKVAEEVFDERIKRRFTSVYEGLSSEEIRERMTLGTIGAE